MDWHVLHIEKVFELTLSSSQGLTSAEASLRLKKFGPNVLEEKKKKPKWVLFLNQFRDFMIMVLIAAAIISGILGDITDTLIIFLIIILNAMIGFIQELRAEKALDALMKMATVQAIVSRDGKAYTIDSTNLVPGDMVWLEAGNLVPADLRLFEAHNLLIDESALTGESFPAEKTMMPLPGNSIPLGDRTNMAYKSTMVTKGRGAGVVVNTGMNTEFGKIAGLLQEDETATPLKIRMADFGKKLSYIILSICLLLFGIGLLRGEQPLQMLMVSISLAVAAIPEALPALITIALAIGAKRLMNQKALIRKLPAVETLGSVSHICSDKTGTLTMNKMKLVKLQEAHELPCLSGMVSPFMAALSLNHDVKLSDGQLISGDATEIALMDAAKEILKKDFDKVVDMFPRVAELPFDADRKCMTTVHKYGEKFLVLTKGAMESILRNLSETEKKHELEIPALEWANEGIRVLAFAYRIIDHIPHPFSYESIEKELIFSGVTGMIDPPRPEVKLSIAECKLAGIKPVMITGDHPATAISIAREIGIYDHGDLAVSGPELMAMSDEVFSRSVNKISVYARVNPEQKLRIVRSLQKNHHLVAMTGDGVNDAPSLKAADIGVAMGISGTDVSKEAADMILLDDNFSTIVRAVREGRRIYDNIRKFVKYILTCNSAEIWTIFLAPLIGLPMPLLPIHILWINLVTDGLPGLALAGEKAERDIMKRPPRPSGESLFAGGMAYHILWFGLLMAGITLGIQAWAIHTENAHWQTMVFTVLSLSQLGHVLAIRSEREFLIRQGLFTNIPLLATVFFTFLLQLAVIYLPAANKLFKTHPLSMNELLICIGASAILFHAVELEKWIKSLFTFTGSEKHIPAE